MLRELAYLGDIEGNKCTICKLELRKDDIIVTCPTCSALFHEQHLVDWLTINSNCPVCGHDFSAIIKQYLVELVKRSIDSEANLKRYPIIESGKTNSLIRTLRFNPNLTSNTFKNSNTKFRIMAELVLGIILGIFFHIISIFIVIFFRFIDLYFGITIALFGFLIFQIAFWGTVGAIQNFRNYKRNPWNTLVFERENVVIRNQELESKFIIAENIQAFYLDKKFVKTKNNTQFTISLELKTIKDEMISFGTIFETAKLENGNAQFYYLESLISTFYNITPIQPQKGFDIWFNKNKKLILLISVIYIIVLSLILAFPVYNLFV